MQLNIPTFIRLFIYLLIIIIMGNVSALTDLVVHPGIDYFDLEHFIVGGMMAFLTATLCAMLEVNLVKTSKTSASTKLVPLTWFMAITWTVIIFSSLAGDIVGQKETSVEIALQEARTIYEKDLNYYRWATGHDGVFVPITEVTQPNTYLNHIPEYKIETLSGRKLTLVNPEYMIRQVYEMKTGGLGALGHITSLDPIRAENAADPWEKQALEDFENGSREVSSIEIINEIKDLPF